MKVIHISPDRKMTYCGLVCKKKKLSKTAPICRKCGDIMLKDNAELVKRYNILVKEFNDMEILCDLEKGTKTISKWIKGKKTYKKVEIQNLPDGMKGISLHISIPDEKPKKRKRS